MSVRRLTVQRLSAPALSFDRRSLYFFSEQTGPDANGMMPFGLRDLYVSTRTRLGNDNDIEAVIARRDRSARP